MIHGTYGYFNYLINFTTKNYNILIWGFNFRSITSLLQTSLLRELHIAEHLVLSLFNLILQKNYNILRREFNFSTITYLVQTSLLKENFVFHRTCKNSLGFVQVGVAVQKEKKFGNQITNAFKAPKTNDS